MAGFFVVTTGLKNKFGVYVYVYYIYIMKAAKAKPASKPRILKTFRVKKDSLGLIKKSAIKTGQSETEALEAAIALYYFTVTPKQS